MNFFFFLSKANPFLQQCELLIFLGFNIIVLCWCFCLNFPPQWKQRTGKEKRKEKKKDQKKKKEMKTMNDIKKKKWERKQRVKIDSNLKRNFWTSKVSVI